MVNNNAAPTQVGWNRGGLAAAIQGILSAVLFLLPLDGDMRAQLMAVLHPTLGFLSLMGFALLDRWMKDKGLKP